jgi:hypothetical protein
MPQALPIDMRCQSDASSLKSQIVDVQNLPLFLLAWPPWRGRRLISRAAGLEPRARPPSVSPSGRYKAEATMKYQSLEQIALEADVHPGMGMSRRERLERWVELLEQRPHRRLSTIEGTEFGSRREREAKRADHSPLTVAFEDPVLRAAGLRGDRIGDAVGFFDLSHGEVHRLVCYCHHGRT